MKALNVLKYVGYGILGLGFMFFFLWLIMLLWNALIPELFHGPELSYWQAAGLFILAKILLSGFSTGGSKHHKSKSQWKSRYHSKYSENKENREEENEIKDQ